LGVRRAADAGRKTGAERFRSAASDFSDRPANDLAENGASERTRRGEIAPAEDRRSSIPERRNPISVEWGNAGIAPTRPDL
jgi:hypothetical protein